MRMLIITTENTIYGISCLPTYAMIGSNNWELKTFLFFSFEHSSMMFWISRSQILSTLILMEWLLFMIIFILCLLLGLKTIECEDVQAIINLIRNYVKKIGYTNIISFRRCLDDKNCYTIFAIKKSGLTHEIKILTDSNKIISHQITGSKRVAHPGFSLLPWDEEATLSSSWLFLRLIFTVDCVKESSPELSGDAGFKMPSLIWWKWNWQ